MIARVIPSLRLPRKLDGVFDYAVPEALAPHLAVGSCVMVPWRSQIIPGIVVSLAATGDPNITRLKAITGIVGEQPLPNDIIPAIEDAALATAAPPATITYAFFPKLTIRTAPLLNPAATPRQKNKKAKRQPRRLVVRHATTTERNEHLVKLVTDAAARGDSSCILTPHAWEVEAIAALLVEKIGQPAPPIELLHGGLSAPDYRHAWLAITKATQPIIVIGTRIAALAPIQSLGAIAILECDSLDHRQYDQNPRFDARRIALNRAETAGADIAFMSHAPRSDEASLVQDHGFTFIPSTLKEAAATIVTPPAGGKQDFTDRFGAHIGDAIAQAVQQGKRVLIFHNRRGMATVLACRDCGHVFRCKRCETALVVHPGNQLQCHRCGEQSTAPVACPSCGGVTLAPRGFGVQALERLVKDAFPEAKVARLDSDAAPLPAALHDADILIGTHLLLHDLCEGRIAADLGAVIGSDADSWFFHSGYRSLEQAWRIARQLRDLATASEAPLYLVSVDPEQPKLRTLLEPWETFTARELQSRRAAHYPPYADIIALTASDADKKQSFAAAAAVAADLTRALGKRVFGPLPHATPFLRGKWRHVVIVKSQDSAATLPLLRAIPDAITIEINPDSITA